MTIILEDLDCYDLVKIGTAKIHMSDGELQMELEGFKFAGPVTCRESSLKSLLWLRAVIDAQIKTTKLLPGGTVVCSVN